MAEISKSARKIYTTIEFIDIAGLVRGASQGEGLGNKFLANIREVDAIAHVVRVFPDEKITHVYSKIDPGNDIEVIQTELELADLEMQERRSKKDLSRFLQNQNDFDKKSRIRDFVNPAKLDIKSGPPLDLLTDKKVIFVFNISEKQSAENWKPAEELLKTLNGRDYVTLSTPLELALSEADPTEKEEYMKEFGITESGLDYLIKTAYKTLDLITFLTTGEDETRAWTAGRDDLIPKAARAIHTDFEKLFIRAEVINWETLLDIGSHSTRAGQAWAAAKSKGLIKTVGRDYIIKDGDVVEIKI